MQIEGIDKILLSVRDLEPCSKFLIDMGLTQEGNVFKTLNSSLIELQESSDDQINQIVFGVNGLESSLSFVDPNGIEVVLQASKKVKVHISAVEINGWNSINRINKAVPLYKKATPIEIGHVVIATPKFLETEKFYKDLGFVESDKLLGRGVFLRANAVGGHHDIFLINAEKFALHHIAFTTRDIYELFAGGMYMDQQGWSTEIGPGRHPISSSFFWYLNSPFGYMMEYTCNEDFLTEEWKSRTFEYSPGITTEWAIEGGIDYKTKRQKK
jgi:catechol 2,3-dioxygenase-like lactoylglutathione lyase family enzyme